MRSVRRILAASTLSFEAFAVFFGGLVAKNLSSLSLAQSLLLFSWLALLCLLCAGTLRSRWGYWFGTALQLVIVATGFWVHTMYVVGGLFAVIWVLALVLGGRADADNRARAERAQQEAA